MIHRPFIAPNYSCVVEDQDGNRARWLTYGPSKQAIQDRLEAQGWEVIAINAYDFARWRSGAAKLIARLPANRVPGDPIVFRERQWTVLKLHLFELFGGKCAYCEARVRHVASGDVEHFRPKRRVDEDEQHPGYYWLAYEPTNLLPACEACNRSGAKGNHFPTEDGVHARSDHDLGSERPLLLNPYVDLQPAQHLQFLDSGDVRGRSDRGECSKTTYRLSRPALREVRRDQLEALGERVAGRIASGRDPETVYLELIGELSRGEWEYSAALLQHMVRLVDELDRRSREEYQQTQRSIQGLRRALNP